MGKLWLMVTIAAAAVCGLVLAMTMAAMAATNVTVSPRDNCGGFNGHVVWSGGSSPYIQLYGEVWQNQCSSDDTSVWLAWDSPTYHNVKVQSAAAAKTQGVNYKTTTSAVPQDMKVTVCSQAGGWHCGTPVEVSPSQPAPTTTTTTPVVTTPVPVPLPQPPPRRHALRVKLTLSWTWDYARTRLRRVTIGSLPGTTRLVVQCRGNGCPKPATAVAKGPRRVHRLLHRLQGRRYRAGDRLVVSLSAPGWTAERDQIKIRSGRIPTVRRLAA